MPEIYRLKPKSEDHPNHELSQRWQQTNGETTDKTTQTKDTISPIRP